MKKPERFCVTCGTEEDRRRVNGRELVNINPLSGQCIDCLARAVRGEQRQVSPEAEAVRREG
jgi:hypothetical protein